MMLLLRDRLEATVVYLCSNLTNKTKDTNKDKNKTNEGTA